MIQEFQPLKRDEVLASLPDEGQEDLMPDIRRRIQDSNTKVVVLDDDPTGTQTVHDVNVLAVWTVESLKTEFEDDSPAVFILTNTRSMLAEKAEALNREIAQNLSIASKETARPFVIVSRSDSTLRGHFPLEMDILADELNLDLDAVLIIPAFMAGGRFTINSVHYVAEGDNLIPANKTPFAQDATFGYKNADLREWVAEKTEGRVDSLDVQSITLDDIRTGGADAVTSKLMALKNASYCVIDAISEADIAVTVSAILQAESQGKQFLYRTAASFAAIRAGISLNPVLSSDALKSSRSGGGLIVVGSYVPKSSSQLAYLLDSGLVIGLEVQVSVLLNDEQQQSEISRICEEARQYLLNGKNVVIFTSRELITGDSAETSLSIGNIISDSLVNITAQLQIHARYIIAKGGITSSDLATKSLEVKRARVIGQILPGIPVWKLDKNCAVPDLTYVVFPGNVGDVESLADAVRKFEEV